MIPPLSIFYSYIITGYTYYMSVYSTTEQVIGRLTVAYNTLFVPRIYVFYKGYLQPVPYKHNTPKESCQLFYNVDTSLFYSDNNWDGKRQVLPILSMEIRDMSNNLVYDLTNFIEGLRFVASDGGGTVPSFSSIVMLWATLNDMYFDPVSHKIQYIDTMGDTHESTFTNTIELVRN
jgi:hypothetical protein